LIDTKHIAGVQTDEALDIDTRIPSLGKAKVDTNLPSRHFATDENTVMIHVTDEQIQTADRTPLYFEFELAGPRPKLYFDPPKCKCAIVTSGGLCPGINYVIRSIVMESHHNYHVSSTLGIRFGLEGFIPKYAHEIVELTPQNVANIHQFGGTILGSSRGPQPIEEIVDALERMNISVLFMIGGDGTMKAAQKIVEEIDRRRQHISIIGIPKTIDNDINFVTKSFGFDTAVEKATEAIQCAPTEAIGAVNGVGMVKLMGRESGFIAAHATLALKEVNLVLIPEVLFRIDGPGGVLEYLERRLKRRQHAVVVVAEGAGQHLLNETGQVDPSGNPVLGDISALLIRRIKNHFKDQTLPLTLKFIAPSYIIRSVPANANDRVYCGMLGQTAVHAAMAGKTGMVISQLMDRYVHMPLSLVTKKRRKLNIRSSYWRAVLETTGQWNLEGMLVDGEETSPVDRENRTDGWAAGP